MFPSGGKTRCEARKGTGMSDNKLLTVAEMEMGWSGIVVEGGGGHGFANRLAALGIRPGKRVTKTGWTFMRGPVVIQVDRAEVALGFGMAKRILVQLD